MFAKKADTEICYVMSSQHKVFHASDIFKSFGADKTKLCKH